MPLAVVRGVPSKFLCGDKKLLRELPEFWIDKTLVTNAEYARFVAATGREPPKHWKGQSPPQYIPARRVV
jgi:formylglycine-generating enzyme required for sulfatase activity